MRSGLYGLKATLSLVAVMALTGAKSNGCGPDFDDSDPDIICPDGSVQEGDDCVIIVDPICPDGYAEQTFCEGSSSSSSVGGGDDPTAPDAPPFFEEEQCWTECVPVVSDCPPGFIEQTVCPEPIFDGGGGEPGIPPGECFTECVPDTFCPPGSHEE